MNDDGRMSIDKTIKTGVHNSPDCRLPYSLPWALNVDFTPTRGCII